MYLLTNGKIITEESILEGFDLLIQDDVIKRICRKGEIQGDDIEIVDAEGGYISPGFIDIHADYIENMSSPRPTSIMDFNLSIRETEKVLVNTGITTMYHSLSLYGKDLFENKPIRSDGNVIKLIEVIGNTQKGIHLIRHRFHARFEIDNVKGVERLKEYIREGKINLLSFMDHTPGQGQYRNIEVYRKILKGYKDISDEEIDEMIEERQNKETITISVMEELAAMAEERGISIASHDDDTCQKVDFVRGIGASISEFPITIDIAKYAKQKGMFTVGGVPNILLGKSHAGNLSAAEAIKENCIDILCSDYYLAAMLHSVFRLNEKYNMELCEMFKLVTINPAKAVKIDNVLGSIKEGKKADILIIKKLNDLPVITTVFVDGQPVSKINYRI